MNVHRVNAAAGVLLAAMQQGKELPACLAYTLEAAGLLQSPESAAELQREVASSAALAVQTEQQRAELEVALSTFRSDAEAEIRRLRVRVTELDAARERLAEVMQQGQHWSGERLVSERLLSQREIRHATGIPLRAPVEGEYRYCGADLNRTEFPFTCYRRVAHKGQCSGQPDPEPAEAQHEGPEAHAYRIPHDLPEYPRG